MNKIKVLIFFAIYALAFTRVYAISDNKQVQFERESVLNDSLISNITISKEAIINEAFLVKWLKENFFDSNIELAVKKAASSGNAIEYYSVIFLSDVPNNTKKSYSFIFFMEERLLFLVPFEYNFSCVFDNKQMFGGYYSSREYDFYLIFHKNANKMILVFDSRLLTSFGLKVGFYRDDECIEYKPARLLFRFNSKERIITFSGKIARFCEERVDRDLQTKKPLSIQNVKIMLKYNQGKWRYLSKSNYVFW